MPQVSIVIVSMNRPDLLFPCLDSIREHTSLQYETLVVAYLFTPENLKALRERYPWVIVVISDELRGFAENNNLALRQARGRYCFILNDDTLLHEPVIDELVAAFAKLPDTAAALSPAIRFADGRLQTCGRSPWTPWRYAKHYLHWVDEAKDGALGYPGDSSRFAPSGPSHCLRRSLRELVSNGPLPLPMCGGAHAPGYPKAPSFRTYTLNGACFLIRTDPFREAGWFDERFFFTPEDIALGHRLNELGYSVWACPDVTVTHLAGGSVSEMECAIKPARVRGSMIFYGEPFLLKGFIWCVELVRYVKNSFGKKPLTRIHRASARNVMKTVFSSQTPKEIFIRFKP